MNFTSKCLQKEAIQDHGAQLRLKTGSWRNLVKFSIKMIFCVAFSLKVIYHEFSDNNNEEEEEQGEKEAGGGGGVARMMMMIGRR